MTVHDFTKSLGVIGKAIAWIFGVIVAMAGILAFFRMPGDLQISASILAAGAMVAAAIVFRPAHTINVYDRRVRNRDEGGANG